MSLRHSGSATVHTAVWHPRSQARGRLADRTELQVGLHQPDIAPVQQHLDAQLFVEGRGELGQQRRAVGVGVQRPFRSRVGRQPEVGHVGDDYLGTQGDEPVDDLRQPPAALPRLGHQRLRGLAG